MAQLSTLLRFRIDLSDVDRGVYEALDFRVAQHPSENAAYLLTRVVAYALNIEPGLQFNPGGLSDTDEPCLRKDGVNGPEIWIEIGNPTARKVHRASKAARKVMIYTYKDPEALLRELRSADVHKADTIEIYSLDSSLLKALEGTLEKDNRWSLLRNEGSLHFTMGARTCEGELHRHSI